MPITSKKEVKRNKNIIKGILYDSDPSIKNILFKYVNEKILNIFVVILPVQK